MVKLVNDSRENVLKDILNLCSYRLQERNIKVFI